MTRLIINGDDFGMSEGVTLGILKAHREGILRSTTMMVNMPFAKGAAMMAKEYPDLGIGLHLTLTAGRPVSDPKDIPSLVDENGNFHSHDWYKENTASDNDQINYDDVLTEYRAQLNRFVELNGKLPTHIDSHHHSSALPRITECANTIIKENDLPARIIKDWVYSDYERPVFSSRFYAENVCKEFFLEDRDHILDYDLIEYMAHPAFVDQYVLNNSSYNVQRAKELEILCSDEIKQWVKDNNIELINFTQIKKIK